jgi:hypothetical protein
MNPRMPQLNHVFEPTTAKNDPTNDARRCACNKCGCTKTMDKSGEICDQCLKTCYASSDADAGLYGSGADSEYEV